MKHLALCIAVAFSTAPMVRADTAELLGKFKSYEQGKPVSLLAEVRQGLFAGTGDVAVRAERERALLAFIASEAHPQAKSIAIDWLGCLGGAASVPALVAARNDPALAAAAARALERIPDPTRPPSATPTAPPPKPAVAAVAEFIAASAKDPAGDSADKRLIEAVRSPNELLAGAALRRIRAGDGSPELAAKLLAAPDQVPPLRMAHVCDALATRNNAAAVLHPYLSARTRTGPPPERAAAIKTLGRILRPADVPVLLGFAAEGNERDDVPVAARAAFARATDPGINATLIRIASDPQSPISITAITILSLRQAREAIDPLWAIVDAGDNARATAALATLGELLGSDDLTPMLRRYAAAADGSPLADAYGKAVWSLSRRHPDPAIAAETLTAAAAKAPAAMKVTLEGFSSRILPKDAKPEAKPTPKPEVKPAPKPEVKASVKASATRLVLPDSDDRATLAPDGFVEIAYRDCGASDEGAPPVRRILGSSFSFDGLSHPLATVDCGKEVSYEITGLDPTAEHVLGLTCWDADMGQRRQSLSINGKSILPSFAPIAYLADQPTFARIHVPVPRDATASGKITLSLRCDAGENAVVSQLWVLRKPPAADAAPRKRILIVTGDDHSAHHWRKTGPEFARILRADPRLEVTLSESPVLLESPALTAYASVFLHFKNYAKRLPTNEPLWRNLENYVQGGGGLVIAHFGCGAMQEWNGFVMVAGRVWDPKKRAHDPYGEFLVRITNPTHPVTRQLNDFTTRDELYTCLAGEPPIEVLAAATSKVDQSTHPMAFVLTPGKGRVFHCTLGHNLSALEAKGARDLYLRGTLWTAGL